MDKGQPWQVVIMSGWRARLLKKSVGFWPRSQGDVDRVKGAKGHSFVLATYLLFSLFHMHVRAMTFGYHMSYLITENSIEIDYTPSTSS
jgi:hypothetical protein